MKTRRTLRTHRGGGTASWGFAPTSHTNNNGLAWTVTGCGSGTASHYLPPGGGLPGLQKGGGGGAHYGFNGGGLAGGNGSYTSNCANTSGASGQLNVPVVGGLLRGGRRNRRSNKKNKNKRANKTNKTNKRKTRR